MKKGTCNFPVNIVRYWGEVPTPANQSTGSSSNASPAKPSPDSPSSDAPKEEEEEESEDDLGWGLFDNEPPPDLSKVPEETYIILEPQWEWNKKHLTHNYTTPEKNRGVKVASQPDSYPVTDYYYKIPRRVLKDKSYKKNISRQI